MPTDPFSEFGGKSIDPFTEFGGQSINQPTTNIPAKQFLADYMSSPIYKQRLANFGITDKPDVQSLLNTNIISQPGYGSGHYSPLLSNEMLQNKDGFNANGLNLKPNIPNINIDRNEIKRLKKNFGYTEQPDNVLAHELSHQSRDLGTGEQIIINSLNKNKDINQHDDAPNEIKADLDALRFMMYKKGIYDTSKRDMTQDDFNKVSQDPEIKKSLIFNRLLKRFKPSDLIQLNNSIAMNTQINPNNNYT